MSPIIKATDNLGGYLSVAGAAERSGYQVRTIVYLANTGAIRAVRFASVLAISRESLDAYVAYRQETGARRRKGA